MEISKVMIFLHLLALSSIVLHITYISECGYNKNLSLDACSPLGAHKGKAFCSLFVCRRPG